MKEKLIKIWEKVRKIWKVVDRFLSSRFIAEIVILVLLLMVTAPAATGIMVFVIFGLMMSIFWRSLKLISYYESNKRLPKKF